MYDSHLVEISHSVYHGKHDGACLPLSVMIFLDDSIKQLSPGHQFEHEAVLFLVLVDFVELDDVGVVDLRELESYLAHDDDFVFEGELILTLHSLLLVNFDGVGLVGGLVIALFHDTEAACPESAFI